MRSRAGAGRLLAGAAIVIATTTGCSRSGSDTATEGPRSSLSGAATSSPAFNGPWASEFSAAYRAAATEFERTALADGIVTDAEFAEMEQRFGSCMHDHGVEFTAFKAAGGYDFRGSAGMTTAHANAVADDCSSTTGVDTIGLLYFQVMKNPERLDDATIIAACLVRKRAVPEGYSARDYERDAPQDSFPFRDSTAGGKALEACSEDPLGLAGASR